MWSVSYRIRKEKAAMVKAFPDTTGFAPRDMAWMAYDEDTYDGAPDAARQTIGWGASAEVALADYHANRIEALNEQLQKQCADALRLLSA